MDKLQTMQTILSETTGSRYCPICGTPFKPYHSRQQTCGSVECKKAYHDQWIKDDKAKDPDKHRKRHTEANRKYRIRKRLAQIDANNSDLVAEHWEKRQSFDEKIAEYGDHYGEVQAKKILESVPKIKTEL